MLPRLEYDLTDLLCAFSELLPLTNEELGQYWLRYNRDDGCTITLDFSVYDNRVGVLIKRGEVALTLLSLTACHSVRVTGKPTQYGVEIVGSRNNPEARCFLSLDGNLMLQFDDTSRD